MILMNANLCISEAKSDEEPDMHLCSLAEKVALKFLRRDSFDFQKEGANGLRFYGRVFGCRSIKDGTYIYAGDNSIKIDSFSVSLTENLKLLASSSLARCILAC